jgi:hypothetical protein
VFGCAVMAAGYVTGARSQSLSDEKLNQRIIQSRGAEAVIWGMAAVNYDLIRQEALKSGIKENEIIYWGKPLDWHNQNSDAKSRPALFHDLHQHEGCRTDHCRHSADRRRWLSERKLR